MTKAAAEVDSPTVGAAPAKAAAPSVDDRLRALEEVVEVLAGPPGSTPGSEVSLQETQRTRQALEQIEREDMQARVARWVAKERDESNALVSALDKRIALSSEERAALEKIAADEIEQHGRMLDELWGAEPPGDATEKKRMAERWDEVVARMRELRSERDKKFEELLGAERYFAFQQLAKEPPPRRTSSRPPR